MSSAPDPRLVELARSVAASLVEDVERTAMEQATARVRERLVAGYAAALEEALLDELSRRRRPADAPAAEVGQLSAEVGQLSAEADEPAAEAREPAADVREPAADVREPAVDVLPRSEPPAIGWYLYAVVDQPDTGLIGEPGLDRDHAIETVGEDGVVAVGSPVRLSLLSTDDADLSPDGWLAGALRRHEEIVERAGRTAIPMRFGTVYPSRDDVRRLLTTNRPTLSEELARLAGTAEWGVKLVGERAQRPPAGRPSTARPAATRPSDGRPADGNGSPSGAGYLRGKAESRAQTLQAQEDERSLLSSAHERLAAAALDAVLTPVQRSGGDGPTPLLNASYLVAVSRLPDFERAVAALADDCRDLDVEVQVTGPWPPYHFTRLELADPGPAR